MTTVDNDLRQTVATACRVLAREGLVNGVLGHVSARTGTDELLLRCRGPHERGLRWTTPDDVWRVGLDGTPIDLPDGYELPKEASIHLELMRRHPDVGAVVHAHPPAALLFGLADLKLRPIIGAYNIPAMRLAVDGVPVYPRPILITRTELAAEVADTMDGAATCLMTGHGITVTGATVEEAVVRAHDLTVLMDITVKVAQLGAQPSEIAEHDIAELPDLGTRFNAQYAWNALVADLDFEDGRGTNCVHAHG